MPTIQIEAGDVPQIREWKEGRLYKLNLKVRQIAPTEDGQARFEVLQGSGSPAEESSRSSFRRAFAKGEDEVIPKEPSP